MGFFKRKNKNTPVTALSEEERVSEIRRLESEREENTKEIEKLLLEYARISGDGAVIRGARRVGKSPKDASYWQN